MTKKKETTANMEAEAQKTETDSSLREEEIRIKELEKELEEAKAKNAEIEDRLLRTLAEYDNFKKRSIREKEDLYFASKSDLIKRLLPIFDNFERAQKFSSGEEYQKGVEMIIRQFFETLEGMEIREIAKVGDEFDPNFHEAVFREEKEGVEENMITEVLQKGYAVGEKVIRHAMVKVSG